MPLFHIKGIHVHIQDQVHVLFLKPWQVALHIKQNNNAYIYIYLSYVKHIVRHTNFWIIPYSQYF